MSDAPITRRTGVIAAGERRAWLDAVYAEREAWVAAFGGEQYSLGRAFYTHYEEGESRAYFAGARESDALVERCMPGAQERMRALVRDLVGARVVAPRRGWCGPGVHVFPAGEKVARRGGVVHFDTEGLTEHHLRARRRAVTAIVMLQSPEEGGGLRVWEDVRWAGSDDVPPRARRLDRARTIAHEESGAVCIDSYLLHQIEPFGGARDRISITVHAAEIDEGVWESWF